MAIVAVSDCRDGSRSRCEQLERPPRHFWHARAPRDSCIKAAVSPRADESAYFAVPLLVLSVHSFTRVSSLILLRFVYIVSKHISNLYPIRHSTATQSASKMQSTYLLPLLPFLAFAAPVDPKTPFYPRADNLQTFTGALGGIAATPITNSGNVVRPFQVKADTFVNLAAAKQRSCDQQFNACANAANNGTAGLSVSACSTQQCESEKSLCESCAERSSAMQLRLIDSHDGDLVGRTVEMSKSCMFRDVLMSSI